MERYIKRLAEAHFEKISNFFPVVLVTGPRQVGKTTMLHNLSKNQNRVYVTLDDLDNRNLALNDPKLFFQTFKPPIIIDEVQYAPNLFSYIKIMADTNMIPGEFWLTGSQSYDIMKNINESLAGRVGIINMFSLTHKEALQINSNIPLDFSLENLVKYNNSYPKFEINSVFEYIYNGGMPKLYNADITMRKTYFNSYVNTYLMRDVVELGKITDLVRFNKFLVACASQIGNVVNYANLANASDISQPTAKEWLTLLQGMGIVYLIQPYFNNSLKRLTKTPKLYFYDTGLCSYLAKIPSAESLQVSSFAGAYFENYVINQIHIKYQLLPQAPDIYFYRDIDKNEVDLLISSFEGLVPIEVKLSANPNIRNLEKFKILPRLDRKILNGGIICMIDNLYPVDDKNCLIPVGIL